MGHATMTDGDPYPDLVKRSAKYARRELDDGFAPDLTDFMSQEDGGMLQLTVPERGIPGVVSR